jgi:hypothetical protein
MPPHISLKTSHGEVESESRVNGLLDTLTNSMKKMLIPTQRVLKQLAIQEISSLRAHIYKFTISHYLHKKLQKI